jgi:hypothetical protein
VRKEQRQRGDGYWVAYARRGGRLRKAYVGRGEQVTGARLDAVATALAQLPATLGDVPPDASPPPP